MPDNWHVVPTNDTKKHNTNDIWCKCNPKLKWMGECWMIVHRSWDRRENKEPGAITPDLKA